MNFTKSTCRRKSKATTKRLFPPATSNLARSRFNTFDFGAALWTSSIELQCAALMSRYQRSSATRASGCSFQNSTSVLRAMTLMVVYIMFPSWEQVKRGAAASHQFHAARERQADQGYFGAHYAPQGAVTL